jgi:ATP-dependent Clp protease ATP-binding subunit ClpA
VEFEGELGFKRRASHVLHGAVGEALALGRNYVGTEHILLTFYRDSAGVTTSVLQELGLDESAAWSAIRAVLNELENAK